jgi:hypothetical protein
MKLPDPADTSTKTKETFRQELAELVGLPLGDYRCFFTPVDDRNVKTVYNTFVTSCPDEAARINEQRPDGVGPCELITAFVADNVTLGGKNSPIDFYRDGKPWAEGKAGRLNVRLQALEDFKITSDSSSATVSLMSDLTYLNEVHTERTGTSLPGWRGPGALSASTLNSMSDFSLSTLPPVVGSITFKLMPCGTVSLPGQGVVGNIYEDGVRCLLNLIGEATPSPIDPERTTYRQVVTRWVSKAFDDYLQDKKMALFNSATLQMMYFGKLDPSQVDLLRTHRQQPWARVHLKK